MKLRLKNEIHETEETEIMRTWTERPKKNDKDDIDWDMNNERLAYEGMKKEINELRKMIMKKENLQNEESRDWELKTEDIHTGEK